jgi:hypothetical protein
MRRNPGVASRSEEIAETAEHAETITTHETDEAGAARVVVQAFRPA